MNVTRRHGVGREESASAGQDTLVMERNRVHVCNFCHQLCRQWEGSNL